MWRRRLVGWLWIGAWLTVLTSVHAPWSDLGGIVSERTRWIERVTLGTCAIFGAFAGAVGRERSTRPGGPSHAALVRWIWIPPAAAAAAVAAVAALAGRWAETLIALVGILSYWAGLDAAFGAWPLACGAPYSFSRPIPVEEREQDAPLEEPSA